MKVLRRLQEKRRAFLAHLGDQPLAPALLRWFGWALRCLSRQPAIVEIPRYGMRLFVSPQWKGCWKAIYVFRGRFFEVANPELEFVRGALKPGQVFVDAGAYHGWYAITASRIVGDFGRALAFEPNPDAHAVLVRNVELSRCPNLRVFEAALADAEGEAWLYKGPVDAGSSGLAPMEGWRGQAKVTVRRLDGVLAELGIPRVDMIKVDVQGAEASLLRGAMGMLQTSRPIVIFEIDPTASREMGASVSEAWDMLAHLGYRFFRYASAQLEPLAEFPVVPEGQWINAIAKPDHTASFEAASCQ